MLRIRLLLFSAILNSCQAKTKQITGGEKAPESNDTKIEQNPEEQSNRRRLAKENPFSLDGTWQSKCISLDPAEIDPPKYGIASTSFSGSSAVNKHIVHKNSDCHETAYQISQTYSFTIENEASSEGIYNFNYVVSSTKYTVLAQSQALYLSQNRWCGISDWRVNQEVDITKCLQAQNRPVQFYNLAKVDDSQTVKALYWGNTLLQGQDGSSPDKRPRSLHPEPYYQVE